MLYTKKSFTLPVAQGVSKEEWDRIFNPRNRRKSLRLSDIHRIAENRAGGRTKRTVKSPAPCPDAR